MSALASALNSALKSMTTSQLAARNRDLTDIRSVADKGIVTDIDQINGLTKQIVAVTAEITMSQSALQARMAAGARISQLSLLDYLK